MNKLRKIFISAIILILLSAGMLFSQYKPRVSVVPFNATKVAKHDAATLTLIFETDLVNTEAFEVIEQAEADKILKAQEYTISDCTDENCAVEIGKQLAADHIFLGNVSLIGSKYVLNIKLIDIQEGKNIRAESVYADSVDGLVEQISVLANIMAGSEELYSGRGEIEYVDSSGTEKSAPSLSKEEKSEQKTYVTFLSDPPGVAFKIYGSAGRLLSEGFTPSNLRLSRAMYSIEAESPLYYPFKEKLSVTSDRKIMYTIRMKPNFGSIEIESYPEGAEVLLNGLKVGTTPFHSERMKSGNYSFVVEKELCASKEIKIKVEDGKTSRHKVDLTPEFIWFSIREANQIDAGLYVNGKYKGRLPFRDRISYSPFTVEVKSDDQRYRPYSESISPAKRGGTIERKIALEGIHGNVAVDSEPFLEGDIYIDGKKRGTVPDQFDLLIGEHEIVVKGVLEGKSLMGTKNITVKEGEDIELTLSMAEERKEHIDKHTDKLIETVYVAPGSFSMGSTGGDSDENIVRITSGFYISKYEVTVKQWREVMGNIPSGSGDNLPVANVSWYDAVEFCNALSRKEGLKPCYSSSDVSYNESRYGYYIVLVGGQKESSSSIYCNFSANGYRLPTEAEWEYAARGGNESRGYKYAGSNSAMEVAWYRANRGRTRRPREVGRKKPNELGLYDMSGNVWEWCWDWHGEYSSSSQTDPSGPSEGVNRVVRGGNYGSLDVSDIRVDNRSCSTPSNKGSKIGFRPVRTAE